MFRLMFIVLLFALFSSTATANECGEGIKPINKLVTAKKETPLRISPDESAAKLVNQRASEALHKTEYAGIDESSKVTEVCRKGAWSYVELVEPRWLRATHKGWVPTSSLNANLMSKSGKRIYRESEVGWDEGTKPYKKEILASINGFLQDKCKNLKTWSVVRVPATPSKYYESKGTNADPVFFITCGSFPSARNIYFSLSEMRKHF